MSYPDPPRQKRPDAFARARRASRPCRAPLPEAERAQLARLAASCGNLVAARMLGVNFETFVAAMNGAEINPSTATKIRASGWLRGEHPDP